MEAEKAAAKEKAKQEKAAQKAEQEAIEAARMAAIKAKQDEEAAEAKKKDDLLYDYDGNATPCVCSTFVAACSRFELKLWRRRLLDPDQPTLDQNHCIKGRGDGEKLT
eukprot:SAG31_NODE_452_length_15484_cov_20.883198_11_plen_108_part_00